MAQPTPYNPAHEFLTDEGANPNFPGSEIDIELNALELTTDEILANLALIQRADGDLANASVGMDQLTDAVKAILGDADTLDELEEDIESVATNAAAAATSASNAATSASNASTSASNASTSASNAATSASNASTSATNASNSASTASTHATNASNSASTASTQATNAANSAAAAAASFDAFDDIYLGSKAANPTLDNDGDPLVEGQLYWNSVANELRVYDGAVWSGYSASTVTASSTTTFTNKTLDANGTGNSITNIETADVAAGSKTGADAKLATGTAGTSGNVAMWNADGDLVDASVVAANILVDADVGVSVQAYDADTAKLDVEDQTLTGGCRVTSKSLGTVSSGTVTPDPGDRPMQHYTNGGAHTLAPGTNKGAYYLDIVNDGSAGAITKSGWTKETGAAFTTTNGHKFRCYCSVGEQGSSIHTEAFQ